MGPGRRGREEKSGKRRVGSGGCWEGKQEEGKEGKESGRGRNQEKHVNRKQLATVKLHVCGYSKQL